MKNQNRTSLRTSMLAMAALSILLIALPGFAQIVNGSFESPLAPSGGYTTFYPPSTIPGWTVVGGATENVLIVDTNYTVSGVLFHAQSGSQWMDLTGGAATAMTKASSSSAEPHRKRGTNCLIGWKTL